MTPRIYSTRSNALRGLKSIHPALAQHATNLIRNIGGKFQIKMNEVDEMILDGFCEQFPEECEEVKSQLIETASEPVVEAPEPVPAPIPSPVKKPSPVVEGAPKVKPFRLAKQIVAEMVALGITNRKDIIGRCMDEGIKYNTADGAYYELVVRPRKEQK